MASERSADELDYGEDIDQSTFEQILEMDDEDVDREFSRQIVFDFLEQAHHTFTNMDDAVGNEDLPKLSELGHFLKGSSATLGLTKVKDACEKIQNWGHSKDETGETPISKKEALEHIRKILPWVKQDCEAAEARLRAFYNEYTD